MDSMGCNALTKANSKGASLSCNLCGADDFNLLFSKSRHTIVKCKNCELVFVNPQPPLEELVDLYDEVFFNEGQRNFNGDATSAISKNAKIRLKKISEIKPFGHLLDVGCGVGCFLYLAWQDYNYKVQGVEISRHAAEYAQRRLGLDVENCRLADFNTAGKFDVVTMWDSIEHMTDPAESLSRCNRLLKKGGLLVLSTGDVESITAKLMRRRWHLMIPPKHLYFFSKGTVSALLNLKGFKVFEVNYAGKYVDYSFLKKKFNECFQNTIFSGTGALANLFPRKNMWVNLFDIMTVYAYKEGEVNE